MPDFDAAAISANFYLRELLRDRTVLTFHNGAFPGEVFHMEHSMRIGEEKTVKNVPRGTLHDSRCDSIPLLLHYSGKLRLYLADSSCMSHWL